MSQRANALVADRLREAADLLEQQNANPFRVRAYRSAADTIATLDEDIEQLAEHGGVEALVALPQVGQGIAAAIVEILHTGRWTQVDRLRGVLDAEHLFQTVPGIGPELALRIHDSLHLDTLEALETAAHDGRLESVPGVGARRAASIRAALASMLSRRRVHYAPPADGPSVEQLLAVDAEYRRKAEAGELPVRLWVMLSEDNAALAARLPGYRVWREAGEHLTVGGIKRWVDGALGSHGAWLLEPYTDLPTSSGLNTRPMSSLVETARLAIQHDFQLCVHAIGDRANREVLDVYEQAFRRNPDKTGLRWRIEHSQHLHPNDIPRFGALGVIPSMQGIHCTSDAPWVPVFNEQRFTMRSAKLGGPDEIFVDPVHVPVNYDYVYSNDVQ